MSLLSAGSWLKIHSIRLNFQSWELREQGAYLDEGVSWLFNKWKTNTEVFSEVFLQEIENEWKNRNTVFTFKEMNTRIVQKHLINLDKLNKFKIESVDRNGNSHPQRMGYGLVWDVIWNLRRGYEDVVFKGTGHYTGNYSN